ncbi:hypothetical protein MYX04_11685 [Nitrospiraceae bacterium AH_259_D15_M11_P09]|nr:hypothetical protein [Nitrospiraceae bacterium AH_259_D15_M11_P09]
MRKAPIGMLVAVVGLAVVAPPAAWTTESLPVEPELTLRLDEHYDHESHMFLMLFSLQGDGKVDYVTGRMVQKHMRSHYGNPVYYTEPFPLFYWWNHTLWNDPTEDGVNGNERVYQENIEFDVTRFKPCVFNGQPC